MSLVGCKLTATGTSNNPPRSAKLTLDLAGTAIRGPGQKRVNGQRGAIINFVGGRLLRSVCCRYPAAEIGKFNRTLLPDMSVCHLSLPVLARISEA